MRTSDLQRVERDLQVTYNGIETIPYEISVNHAVNRLDPFHKMSSRRSSSSKLNIIIVGAGLSGLSGAISCALAGHRVVVLESAKELAEVSSIQQFQSRTLIEKADWSWTAMYSKLDQGLQAIGSLRYSGNKGR